MPENVVLVNDFTTGSVARRLLFHLVSTKLISLIWKISYKTIYKFGHSVRLAILWGIYPYFLNADDNSKIEIDRHTIFKTPFLSGTCLRKQYVVLKELQDLANNLQAQYNK